MTRKYKIQFEAEGDTFVEDTPLTKDNIKLVINQNFSRKHRWGGTAKISKIKVIKLR